MLSEPDDLDRAALAAAVASHWGLRGLELEYLPVGFGSHHWRSDRWFVTVDDLTAAHQPWPDAESAFAGLERAYGTAAFLHRDAGLDFVVAPVADSTGAVVRRLDERYAVTVFPLVDGESSDWGPYESAEERRTMAALLARLHASTPRIPADLPRSEDFSLPGRDAFDEALLDLERPWTSGPFAERTRVLLRSAADEAHRLLRDYDASAARARARADTWVITHGEPHRANVIRGPRGRRHLVDWDTTLLAPRERDLHLVLDDESTGWDAYAAVLPAELDETMLRLYRSWWELADLTTYVRQFREPHSHTEQTAASWNVLSDNLGRLVGRPLRSAE